MEEIKIVNQLPKDATDLFPKIGNSTIPLSLKEQLMKAIRDGGTTAVRKVLTGAGAVGIENAEIFIVRSRPASPATGGRAPELYCEPAAILKTYDKDGKLVSVYIKCK